MRKKEGIMMNVCKHGTNINMREKQCVLQVHQSRISNFLADNGKNKLCKTANDQMFDLKISLGACSNSDRSLSSPTQKNPRQLLPLA